MTSHPVAFVESEPTEAEGERVCAELKGQFNNAHALVREARLALGPGGLRRPERRSFARPPED